MDRFYIAVQCFRKQIPIEEIAIDGQTAQDQAIFLCRLRQNFPTTTMLHYHIVSVVIVVMTF